MSQPLIRLLLVHADSTAAHRLRHQLAEAGCEVGLCRDVDSATEQLAGSTVWELLVLDGSLRDQAAGLCAQLRGAKLPIPVLMLCSGTDEADRVWGLEVGADDVLDAPFGLAECLARCRALVRRHQLGREATTELRCGAVTMRVEEHRVSRDGQDVTLSPREFRLLQFFLEHPRRIWSRDELLARVWGEIEACELDPKTVDVHIRWLRLKLEANPAQPTLITTVRGQGYRCG